MKVPKYKYKGKQEVHPHGVTFTHGETHEVLREINHPDFELVEQKKEVKKETKKKDKE